MFNDLVANRARRGLFQEYVAHEENLAVLRGAVRIREHLRNNYTRPDRIFCRYYENTPDNEDNQIIKWTLHYLLRCYPWSRRTAQTLRANLQQFSAVTLLPPAPVALDRRHYHRLNDNYRPIHNLCRLFLERAAFAETLGELSFHGFLLNMNQLFEDFVTQAFLNAVRRTPLSALGQRRDYLSHYPIRIKPDVTIRDGRDTLAVVDAKYKRVTDQYENHDFYQMLAYGTALQCSQTYLFFPATEIGSEGVAEMRNSPVTIAIRRIDIEDRYCTERMEEAAGQILAEVQTTVSSSLVS